MERGVTLAGDSLKATEPATCILGRLPTKIRWMVFNKLAESIGEMRLVSKSWCAMIEEWMMVPENLAAYERIEIEGTAPEFVSINVRFRKSEMACFRKLRDLEEYIMQGSIEHRYVPVLTHISFIFPYESWRADRLLFGTKVEKIALLAAKRPQAAEDPNFIDAIRDITGQFKKASSLDIANECLSDRTIELFTNIASTATPHTLFCDLWLDVQKPSTIRRFLLEMSERIAGLSITLHNYNRDTFDLNWVELVLEMFEKGATSVDFANYYSAIFDSDDLRQISQCLITRGKPFHFRCILHEKLAPIIIKGLQKTIIKTGFNYIIDLSRKPNY